MSRARRTVREIASRSNVMFRSRSSRQWYVAPITAAARAASARRTREISSGPSSAEPQSPGVQVTMCSSHPRRASSAIVPAARNSQSSGWAMKQAATFRSRRFAMGIRVEELTRGRTGCGESSRLAIGRTEICLLLIAAKNEAMATSALTPNLAAATNGPADAAGFAAARAVCRRHATSFYLASIFLPNAKREAAHAVYAFCRMIAEAFDQIDEDIEGARGLRHHPAVASPVGGCATCGPTGSLDARLATFRERLDDIYAGRLELPMPESRSEPQHALHAFARTADAYEIPKQYFMDLAEGCRMDLTVARYATWSALERYCYHAA